MRHVPGRFAVVALALLALLVGAAPALGAFSVSGMTATATPDTAGAATDMNVSVGFTGTTDGSAAGNAETPKTVTIHFGPGILGNPLFAYPGGLCPDVNAPGQPSFQTDTCPASSQIGTNSITIVAAANGVGLATLHGTLYNLVPTSPDQAGLIGVKLQVAPGVFIHQYVPGTLSAADGGLDSTTTLPDTTPDGLTAIHVTNLTLDLSNTGFISNPTSCIHVPVTATAKSWGDDSSSAEGGYTPTGCDSEPFSSTIDTHLDTTKTDSPTSLGVTAHVPAHNAQIFRSTVTLPKGVTVNPALGAVLDKCTVGQFAPTDLKTAAACPAASQIATATFISPVLPHPVSGAVYYGAPGPGELNLLFVDVPLPGLHLKVIGHTTANPVDGQITNVFDQQPQIPFLSFDLTYNGGPHSIFTTPQTCGNFTTTSEQLPWSAFPAFPSSSPAGWTPTSTFTTSFDGAGAGCSFSFKPTMTTSVANTQAGASGAFTLRFDRPDRDMRVSKAAFKLPAGLVGNLALKGLTQCPLATAAAGNCPDSSRVGSASVQTGVGPEPATLPGQVFLAAPKVAGDPASLSVLVPAKLGPVDLGTIVVGVRLQLRPDGGLTATTDALPQFQGGVPTAVRSVTTVLDRAGFMRNPTSCGAQSSSGAFDAVPVDGATASSAASATLSTTDCAKLAFAPKLSAKFGAKHAFKKGGHPSISTVFTQKAGEANPRSVHVLLPSSLSTDLKALRAACTQAAYDAGKCGKKAKAGTVSATSPLVSTRLTGTAWFVQQGSGKLPKLVMALRGPLSIDVTGQLSVARSGQLATTIAAPDLPVTRLALALHGGRGGVLFVNHNLCTRKLVTRVDSQGQNGKKKTQKVKSSVVGCPKPKKHKKHHR